ncbi:hypothetical protein HK100_003169, partial [Physocladia obscura]
MDQRQWGLRCCDSDDDSGGVGRAAWSADAGSARGGRAAEAAGDCVSGGAQNAAHSQRTPAATMVRLGPTAARRLGGSAAGLVVVAVHCGMHGVVRATGETVRSTRHPCGALAGVADV